MFQLTPGWPIVRSDDFLYIFDITELMAAPAIIARNSVRRRRLSSIVEDSPSFAAKLPSVERGDILEMDRTLDTLLNGVSLNRPTLWLLAETHFHPDVAEQTCNLL